MTDEARPKLIIVYATPSEEEPFTDWLNNLRDVMGRKRILTRISRLKQGNYGDCEPVGEGISELRMFFGPGYRVYFALDGREIVLLLLGGDKSSQNADIVKSFVNWCDYKERKK